jgi:transcriptional regulator with XRE-family HTH domain
MVRRRQAGLSHKQLAAKTGFRFHTLRRWEFDRCLPSQDEWETLRGSLNLPPAPVLTITQEKELLDPPKTIGQHLRKRRIELKLTLAEAAPKMGVSNPSLGLWELDKAFPKNHYHSQIIRFLGYDPFP